MLDFSTDQKSVHVPQKALFAERERFFFVEESLIFAMAAHLFIINNIIFSDFSRHVTDYFFLPQDVPRGT